MKFDDPKVKELMVAERYRKEQEETRLAGIQVCDNKELIIELYAGMGGLTQIYKKYFRQVVTNDVNKSSIAEHNLKAIDFVQKFLWNVKIDMIDFDCYGCPAFEIQKFFETREKRDLPLVLTLSDGLGLWMKRKRDIEGIKKRYLIPQNFIFNERQPWLAHKLLIDEFMNQLAKKYQMKVGKIISIQPKYKNYVLASYKFY